MGTFIMISFLLLLAVLVVVASPLEFRGRLWPHRRR